MNKLPSEQRARIIMSLVEGCSIAATCRMTGAAKMTVLSLLKEVGASCQRFHDFRVRLLTTTKVQADEVWSFCYAKEKNLPEGLRDKVGFGSIWTWTAIDAESKLLITWLASNRSEEAAFAFVRDLSTRIKGRLQISSDGYTGYLGAIENYFRDRPVDYGTVVKMYGNSPQPNMNPNAAASRYQPGRVTSIEKHVQIGEPDEAHISTSFMERWNLTLRMQNRRFTRLTNGFSKKFENHRHMLALMVTHYNFCRKHASLKGRTPAMAAGLTDYVWTAADLLSLDMWVRRRAA